MKLVPKLIVLVLLVGLAACSKNQDNSEPPAALTSIDDQIRLQVDWKLDTRASSNRAAYRLRPLLIGDRAYSIDTGGTISCIDLSVGRRLWKFDTDLSAITGLGGNENALIASSKDGDVVAYRVVEDGLEEIWKTRINSEVRAAATVDGEQVFLRSVDGKLRSMAVADGSQQWVVSRRVPALSLTGNSESVIAGELVFAGFDDGKLIAYDRSNGQTRWEATIAIPSGRTEVERLVDLDSRFVLRDGIIYISSFQGRLAAVQMVSGDILWTREFSSFQPIAVDDEALYLTAEGSHLWSIDKRTGSAFWKQEVLNARKITAPTIIDDKLVVADLDGYLHWFDREDGKLRGRVRASNARSYVQPLIWKTSVLMLDRLGFLYSVSPSP